MTVEPLTFAVPETVKLVFVMVTVLPVTIVGFVIVMEDPVTVPMLFVPAGSAPVTVAVATFVSANPVLDTATVGLRIVTETVDPVTLNDEFKTATEGDPVTVTGTVPWMFTVEPVTENEEFTTWTVLIFTLTFPVVNSGFPLTPRAAPLVSRRFTCSARYFVMRNAAVVVLAIGGRVSE